RVHTRRLRELDGLDAIAPRVRRDDRAVVALAGLEVVVEAIDARRREPLRLRFGQDAERRAQLDVHLGLDALGGGADRVEIALRGPARRGDHAVALGPRRVRAARRL